MRTRILITGASGSGTTTLGRALAGRLGCAFHDADDYYWLPTEPPFRIKQEPALRVSRVSQALDEAESAKLGGSVERIRHFSPGLPSMSWVRWKVEVG